MKKKERSNSVRLSHVHLGRRDLEKIIEMCAAAGRSLKISDDDFEYESLDEFITKRGSRPAELELASDYRSAFINISVKRSYVTIRGDESQLFENVLNLLKVKQTSLLAAIDTPMWFLLAIAFSYLASAKAEEMKATNGSIPSWLLWMFLISICLGLLHFSRDKVLFFELQKGQSFWGRNSDQIWIAILATLFGVIGTLITQYFSK